MVYRKDGESLDELITRFTKETTDSKVLRDFLRHMNMDAMRRHKQPLWKRLNTKGN
ncbi:hypothetical protein [Parasporobacterium paucivorans]|uniref:Uncharacterized protein n=1 Tax=Parasporobacterium paucivorans DSM 15970 TaxID=1122934 RepID=A0A1M6F3R6_9FIRM|nr:hypothetical protein [Parasporobacterium paucivorans]SHI92310.1 hypothetical protein SAMN02745691_01042 [Parasporobacterium paucivorans DSM 15970]